MPLLRPDDLTSLVLRTDFNDDASWDAVRAAVDAADHMSTPPTSAILASPG
ncbi:DUF6924 domain-containing protein [Streptomyces halobius]|uniref:DUF6924 domain-containing protein n=1 Tax=Streptomyces halobius TaxID=2879846 RepID=A0ABY4M3U7_9ACTN|nr:hypothetical protein [Streptomyces halobius]UQA92400.1 hypothetical protein K9S39_11620 [Streptomyces halobius]